MPNYPMYRRDLWASKEIDAGAEEVLFQEKWIGQSGVIDMMGCDVQDWNNWPLSQFSIRINGVPVPSYGKIEDRIGSIDLMTPIFIPVQPYDLIEMYAKNSAAVASLMIGRVIVHTI